MRIPMAVWAAMVGLIGTTAPAQTTQPSDRMDQFGFFVARCGCASRIDDGVFACGDWRGCILADVLDCLFLRTVSKFGRANRHRAFERVE